MRCPHCHAHVDEDTICCNGVVHTWRCRDCRKRSRGAVIPFGRCHLCGGGLEAIDPLLPGEFGTSKAILTALRLELEAHHFYRLAERRVKEPGVRSMLRDLGDREYEHAAELAAKYGIEIQPSMQSLAAVAADRIDHDIFTDPVVGTHAAARQVFDRAIVFEERALRFFEGQAERPIEQQERLLYLELAAEERDHIALLETERALLDTAERR